MVRDTKNIKSKIGELKTQEVKHGQALGHVKQLEEDKSEALRRYKGQVKFPGEDERPRRYRYSR